MPCLYDRHSSNQLPHQQISQMKTTTEADLKELIAKLEKNPSDLDVMNSVAIGYFENPSMLIDNDDLKYFELAYQTKKTVKSIHNLAWYLYFECGEEEKGINIQEECFSLNPSSYLPYYQFGYMLLDQAEYQEAIPYLEKAYQLENRSDILHNIGCCYFQLGQYQKAKEIFSAITSEQDLESRSIFNLALTEWMLSEGENFALIADELSLAIETDNSLAMSVEDICLLYFLLENFEKVSDCLLKQGTEFIDLADWDYLSYSLHKTHPDSWRENIEKSIEEKKESIEEINKNDKSWEIDSEEEKQEYLKEFKDEIQARKKMLGKGVELPEIQISDWILVEYCGCLLFDCQRHGNPKDDFRD
jgi:Tfp pilus assembly protein PilF